MANIDVHGNTRVKTLKKAFQKEYGVEIRIYKGQKFADDDATLASVRVGDPAGDDININANMKVGNLEKKFKDVLGVKVQIENKDGKLADNKVTLGSLLGRKKTPSTNAPQSKPESKKGCLGLFLFLGGIGALATYLVF
jgi:hypothetical protein